MGTNPSDQGDLGRLIERHRKQAGLSINGLARASGVDVAVVHRIEHGAHARPRASTLVRLAETLEIPLADVFAAVGYAAPTQLPSFAPYLRAKYGQLPPEAIAKLDDYFAAVQAEYGEARLGPNDGEDEALE